MKIECSTCRRVFKTDDAFGMLKVAYWDPDENKFIDKVILCPQCQLDIMSNEGYEKLWGEIECR